MKRLAVFLILMGTIMMIVSCAEPTRRAAEDYPLTLMTVTPGPFHAALIQKNMYPQLNPTVYVYPPESAENTNYSLYSLKRGARAGLAILQGPEQNYRTELYIKPADGVSHTAMNLAIYTAV